MKKELINRLNKELEKVFNEVTSNKQLEKIVNVVGKSENLKLYDLSNELIFNKKYNHLSDKEKNDLFNTFCEDEYDLFHEDMGEESLYIDFKQIGKTSSFYVVPKSYFDYYNIEDYTNKSFKEKIFMLLDEFMNNKYGYWNTSNSLMDIQEEKIINIRNNDVIDFIREYDFTIDTLVEDFKNFLIEYFEDVLKVYEYIEDFKRNQCQNFEEYYNLFYGGVKQLCL